MSRHCIFCEGKISGQDRAREHVIPRWLLRHLSLEQRDITFIHGTYKLESGELNHSQVSERNQVLGQFLSGRVCRSCNAGWMSQMEVQIKPLLIHLMRDNIFLDLTSHSKELLARWTLKTAAAYNASANYNYRMPRSHLSFLHSSSMGLPAGVHAFMSISPYCADALICHLPNWVITCSNDDHKRDANEAKFSSFKIGFQFGHLMLATTWWNSELPVSYVIRRGDHLCLWPQRGPCYYIDAIRSANVLDSRQYFHSWLTNIGITYCKHEDGAPRPPITEFYPFSFG